MKCPPIRPPQKSRLRRSGTLPVSSNFRRKVQLRLENALQDGETTSIEQALIAGANPNLSIKSENCLPLILAANKGLDTVLEVLLRYGANVNTCSELGWGPLHVASYHGHLSSVQILLDAGANPRTDNGKVTPLKVALTRNHVEIAALITPYISTEV